MNGLNLDTLRSQWSASNQSLDNSLQLNREAVSRALASRTSAAFRRHTRLLLPGIALAAAALVGLSWFIAGHLNDPLYLSIACALALFATAELMVDTRQWRTLSTLDFSRPALDVQATLDALRARRLRLTKWILLTSVLLWLPMIALLLKALSGFDLLRQLDSSVVWINVLVGLLFIPVALAIGRYALPRWVGKSGMQDFLDDAVGSSWTRAQQQWQRQQDINDAADGALPAATLNASLAQPLRAISRRLLIGSLVFASLIIANGLFSATHGGQWQFILPGIALNLFFVSQMVVRILHRLQLKRVEDEIPNAAELKQRLADTLAMRHKTARLTLMALPALGLAGFQVASKVALDVDFFQTLAAVPTAMLFAIALGLGYWLGHSAAHHATSIAGRLASVIAGKSTLMTADLNSDRTV